MRRAARSTAACLVVCATAVSACASTPAQARASHAGEPAGDRGKVVIEDSDCWFPRSLALSEESLLLWGSGWSSRIAGRRDLDRSPRGKAFLASLSLDETMRTRSFEALSEEGAVGLVSGDLRYTVILESFVDRLRYEPRSVVTASHLWRTEIDTEVFDVAIDAAGTRLALVEQTAERELRLRILDALTGRTLDRLALSDRAESQPTALASTRTGFLAAWIEDGSEGAGTGHRLRVVLIRRGELVASKTLDMRGSARFVRLFSGRGALLHASDEPGSDARLIYEHQGILESSRVELAEGQVARAVVRDGDGRLLALVSGDDGSHLVAPDGSDHRPVDVPSAPAMDTIHPDEHRLVGESIVFDGEHLWGAALEWKRQEDRFACRSLLWRSGRVGEGND